MPNLFVSLPMRGRDEIDIRNEMEDLRELVERDYSMDFDLLDTYEHGNPPDDILHGNMWYLAKSIEMLTMADFVIFAPGWKNASGCIVEHMICALYDIPYAELHVPEIPNLENAEVIMDYTHDLDEQPIEIVDKIDILHRDDDDSMDGNESLAEPEFDDEDYLEPGEYDADIDIPDEDEKDVDELEPGEYDADAEFSETVKNNSDKVVMGKGFAFIPEHFYNQEA